MSKVAVVIDSTTYLPEKYLEQYDIRVAPAVVIWGEEELLDGVDIMPTEFYTRLQSASIMPSTSQPSPAAIKQIYDELLAKGCDILGIYVSNKLSGTVASGKQAMAMLPGANIELVDTLSVSMGSGWPILAAARAAANGAGLKACKQIAEQASERVGVILSVDTLEFLHRGGRIGGAARFLGTALNFKPILEVRDGAIEAVERVRTRRKARERLVELAEERIGGQEPVYLAALHANASEAAQEVLDMASERIKPVETVIADVSPAVGTHAGPDTVGLAFMAGMEMAQ